MVRVMVASSGGLLRCRTSRGSRSPQVQNGKGQEIMYPGEDDKDRSWARRLKWVARLKTLKQQHQTIFSYCC